jgi:hypothetical protein
MTIDPDEIDVSAKSERKVESVRRFCIKRYGRFDLPHLRVG